MDTPLQIAGTATLDWLAAAVQRCRDQQAKKQGAFAHASKRESKETQMPLQDFHDIRLEVVAA